MLTMTDCLKESNEALKNRAVAAIAFKTHVFWPKPCRRFSSGRGLASGYSWHGLSLEDLQNPLPNGLSVRIVRGMSGLRITTCTLFVLRTTNPLRIP